jgi:hypothetical protein
MPEYRTLLETYEEMWQPKKPSNIVVIESVGNNTIRYLTKEIDAFITDFDVTSHEDFKDIMEQNFSDEEKEQGLKELIVKIFKDNFKKCELECNVTIKTEDEFKNINFYGTNLRKLINDYNKDKEIDTELFGENE